MSHYDLVVDTSKTKPEDVVAKILDAYHAWLAR
jgi:cytidylate kinase